MNFHSPGFFGGVVKIALTTFIGLSGIGSGIGFGLRPGLVFLVMYLLFCVDLVTRWTNFVKCKSRISPCRATR